MDVFGGGFTEEEMFNLDDEEEQVIDEDFGEQD